MAQLPPLISFTAGSPAVAGDVNQNFTDIRNHLNGANVDTENIATTLLSRSGGPILNLSQLTENQIAFNVENSQTNTAVSISQLALLATGKSILKLSETVAQTQGDAQLFLSLQSLSTIPAIHVTHGGVDSFKITKNSLNLFSDSTKIDANRIKPPVKTIAERNAIVSPDEGSILYNSTNQELNIKQSAAWVPVGCPIGSVQMFAGSTAPESWLLCDGSTLDSVANPKYAALFSIINTTYGGTGAASFKVPDLRSKIPVGAGVSGGFSQEIVTNKTASSNAIPINTNTDKWFTGMLVTLSGVSGFTGISNGNYYVIRDSSTAIKFASSLANAIALTNLTVTGTGSFTMTHNYTQRSLGQCGGEESHALTKSEIPSHTHTWYFGGGAFPPNTTTQATAQGAAQAYYTGANPIDVTNTGGSGVHNNIQPYLVLNYIIKY